MSNCYIPKKLLLTLGKNKNDFAINHYLEGFHTEDYLKKKFKNWRIIDNSPITGIRIIGSNLSSIRDPRGFKSKVEPDEINFIMNNSIIDCGEIIDKCVYYHSGRSLKLMPVNNSKYEEFKNNNPQIESDKSHLKEGSIFYLYNNSTPMIYIGDKTNSEKLIEVFNRNSSLSKSTIIPNNSMYISKVSNVSVGQQCYDTVTQKTGTFSNRKIYNLSNPTKESIEIVKQIKNKTKNKNFKVSKIENTLDKTGLEQFYCDLAKIAYRSICDTKFYVLMEQNNEMYLGRFEWRSNYDSYRLQRTGADKIQLVKINSSNVDSMAKVVKNTSSFCKILSSLIDDADEIKQMKIDAFLKLDNLKITQFVFE